MTLLIICMMTASTPDLQPVAVENPPQIDGRLDDAVWQQAPAVVDSFVRCRPDPGTSMTEPTEVRIVLDDEAAYFGLRMYDSRPDEIVVAASPRDTDIATDWIGVMLDTFHDSSNCYVFMVSVAGTQYDFRLTEAGGYDVSWDAVWESAVEMDSLGWTAEMRIPWSALRYPCEGEQTWGVNVKRTMSRTNESGFLYPMSADGSIRVEDFGEMVLPHVPLDMPRDLSVYGAGRLRDLPGDDIDPWGSLGADLKLGLSASTTLDLAVNPDFGQVEADPDQINLSNWETYREEKRPFFLEQSELFSMPFGMFYSRRIGAVASSGDVIPILGGARLTGDRSGIRYGVMSAVTGRVWDGGTLLAPASSYLAARVLRETSGYSALGLSLTSVDVPGQDSLSYHYQRVAALDASLELPGSHVLHGDAAGSWSREGPRSRNGAFRAYFSRVDERFDYGGGVEYLQEDFDANMAGYTTETGTVEKWARCGFYIPTGHRHLQNAWGNLNATHDATPEGVVTWQSINPSAGVNFRNRWHLSTWAEISGGYADRYEGPEGTEYDGGLQGGISSSTDSRSPVYLYAGAWGGSYRDGAREGYNGHVAVKPASSVRLELNMDWDRTFSTRRWSWEEDSESERETDWRSARLTAYWIAGSELSLRLNGQISRFRSRWEGAADDQVSGDGWANLLLTWRFAPGSALYLLAGQEAGMTAPGEYTRPVTTFYAKVSYLL